MSNDVGTDDATQERALTWWQRPPALRFHLALALPTTLLLWSASFIAAPLVPLAVALVALLAFAAIWLVRLLHAATARQLSAKHALAPVGGLVVAALLLTHAPLQVRWQLSKSAFEATALQMAEAARAEPDELDVIDRRIGRFSVSHTYAIPPGGAYFGIESRLSTALFNDVAIVYLPDGSSPDDHRSGSFEAPRWVELGHDWFAVTHSW